MARILPPARRHRPAKPDGPAPRRATPLFWLVLAWTFAPWAEAQTCPNWAARLASAEGQVEAHTDTGHWQPVVVDQRFCAGDKIRTQAQSRASLQLANQTYMTLDQRSTLVFRTVEAEKPSWVELIAGTLFARSRTPRQLDIHSHFINAAIRGTEFLVSAGPDRGEVMVIEGEVEASNPQGKVTVKDGQSAVARAGHAPEFGLVAHPEDAVEWALYFPPLLDTASLAHTRQPALAEAARSYAEGRVADALARLQQIPPAQRDADTTAALAGVLLSVGRVDEAEPLLSTPRGKPVPASFTALRSVIALARNHKAEALKLADTALAADAQSTYGWLARSYALQAGFDLEAALAAADRAAATSPDNALVQSRRATLLASLDRWTEAQAAAELATRLDGGQSRPWVVRGFAELRRGDLDAGKSSFEEAARLNPADPMARLGRGLALIREGDLAEGTADMEIAASLDPGDSLIRSYLGKAYYEQKRGKVAEKQFELAERFDPNDPTPWYYNAIMKQTVNRPVEALHDLQRSMQLNGNRAVYRSKLALDEDLAARGAALGRIYGQLGFQPRAWIEGWKALEDDPTDYTSHRLLSDSYFALPRSDIARVSELLQSQLLQPINITPVQPLLAESSVFLLGGLGPADLSLQEFNPLFQRNRFSLLASGMVGSNDTYSDEVVHTGLWDDFSYSLGQFHYQTEGFRPNNNINSNLYNAFVQGRVTPWLNLQAEYRHQEVDRGDLDSRFAPDAFQQLVIDNYGQASETDTYRFGLHANPSEHGDFLASYIHLDRTATDRLLIDRSLDARYQYHGDTGEAQYIQRYENVKAILGGGYYQLDSSVSTGLTNSTSQGNGYLYTHVRYPQQMNWTLGLSVDALDNGSAPTTTQVNPKFGLLWNISPDTVLRMAAFRTMKRNLLTSQTLEPTQIAGFNQFFDDPNGTDATRWGLGLDQRFNLDVLGGVEFSRRELAVPRGVDEVNWRETQYRAYLLWTPHPRWTTSLEYFREQFDNSSGFGALNTRTQTLPLTLSYFDPSGFYTNFKASYFHQDVDLPGGWQSEDVPFLDLGLGYRLPNRWGLAEIQFQNLLDRNYHYEGLQDRRPPQVGGIPAFLPFPPEFTVFARFTLAL
ncbi:FecR family protein [Methylomagnum ishizawai]|uniref:FecR family protein n=1 Tax=Methylomagnum ishizawai TaxID=1760988 RepID=A0A1Y6CZK2_9GAMM|nr:FecR domain-containing protein [Methylomagnum ishizawai]SMF93574.1 FecR family protein [Methylomagnum ishizawai]